MTTLRHARGRSEPPVTCEEVLQVGRARVEELDATHSPVPVRATHAGWLVPVQLVSAAGLAMFIGAVLALHGLRRDLDPADHTMSEYALGSYGWLMRTAFCVLGVGMLATAASLSQRAFAPWRRAGLGLLVGTGFGLFLDAAYNTDRLGVPETPDGAVHAAGTWIIFLTLPVAAVVLGSDNTHSTVGACQSRWLRVLGPAQLVALIAFKGSPLAYRGLVERIGIILALATLAVLQSVYLSSALGKLRGRREASVGGSPSGPVSLSLDDRRFSPGAVVLGAKGAFAEDGVGGSFAPDGGAGSFAADTEPVPLNRS
jgi:hypothetical protein